MNGAGTADIRAERERAAVQRRAGKAAAAEKAKAAAKAGAGRDRQRAPRGLSCQRMYDAGVPLYQANEAWARAGNPASWGADSDRIPCERSYGEVN